MEDITTGNVNCDLGVRSLRYYLRFIKLVLKNS